MNWEILPLQLGFIVFGMGFILFEWVLSRRSKSHRMIVLAVLASLAAAFILFDIYLWINHISFPLNLDLMEGVVWQHFQQAATFQPIYPQPSPSYVPLSYNPLFYVLSVPFSWIFGVNLFTLRLVSIIGMSGIGLILYLAVKQESNSRWWGLVTVGLFAAAYRVMDAYLDTAHSDAWLLFSALLGSYLINQNRSRWLNLVGIIILIASFWFKQHGALFIIGGLLFLTWREGFLKSLVYWFTAVILGPVMYIFAGPPLFGPYFHYYTWEVPRHWSEISFDTFSRYLGFIVRSYPILALSGLLLVAWKGLRKRNSLSIWEFQLVFAMLAGLMGTLDPGSSYNVYIPMGTFYILVGMIGLHKFSLLARITWQHQANFAAIIISFGLLLFNPLPVIIPSSANEAYRDMIGMLQNLKGQVYAPSLGQLQNGFSFLPAAHWVALEDMIRGPGVDTTNNPNTRTLLDPAIHPVHPAYILANYPLEKYPWIAFLNENYTLVTDFGDRFEALRVLPKKWDHGWPRYLYKYTSD